MRRAFRDGEAIGNGYPPNKAVAKSRGPLTLEEATDHFLSLGHKREAAEKLAEGYVKAHPIMTPPGIVVVIKR